MGEGGADGEAGGDSACSSAELQLVGGLRRGKCSGAAAATGREGRNGGARGRRSELGRVRFDPGHFHCLENFDVLREALVIYAASVILGSGLTGILTDSVNSQNAETRGFIGFRPMPNTDDSSRFAW